MRLFCPSFVSARFCLLLTLTVLGGAARAQVPSRTLAAAVTVSPEPSSYESDFTITMTLTPPGGSTWATGNVDFSVDGTVVGSGAVGGATAVYAVRLPSYSIGAHTISARFPGDMNYDAISASTTHQIIGLKSEMSLILSSPTLYYGQTVDAVAQVAAVETAPGATLNGGTITFFADGVSICQLPVSSQQENCPPGAGKGFHAGTHDLLAVYSGNQYYAGATSPTRTFTVLKNDTQATLASSLNPSIYGQSVTFTANLSALYATPVGPVVFLDGSTPIGTATLNTAGVASISVSSLTVGSHDITANYAETPDFKPSVSTVVKQVVVLPVPTPAPTFTTLISSVNPSVLGQNVSFTASVGSTGAFISTPTGTVTFQDGPAVLGKVALDASGVAIYSTSALSLGTHPITAVYGGNTTLAASTSTVLQQQVVTSLPSAGNGFRMTVTPTAVVVGVGNSVSVSVAVVPLNGFNQPVQLSCTDLPYGMECAFDQPLMPAANGTTRLVIHPTAPHDCGSSNQYFIAGGASSGVPILAAAGVLIFGWRRKRLRPALIAALVLSLLPSLGGCGLGNCTDLGVKPGDYTLTVQGTSNGSSPVTHKQTMDLKVHI